MSATVAAALKKIAVAILTDKDILKKVLTVILVLLLTFLMPIFAIVAVLSGDISFNTNELVAAVESHFTAEDTALLSRIENTMNSIADSMGNAQLPGRATEAQALYIMALYDHSGDSNFVSRLTGCFWEGQTDAQLIRRVNQEFGTAIEVSDFTHIATMVRSTYIDYSHYVNPAVKNNLDLAAWAVEAYESGWGYVWGTYGHVLTKSYYEQKLAQYPEGVGEYSDFILENWLGKRTADCIGLIKGYCWFRPDEQTIGYAINGMPDYDTEGAIGLCSEQGSMDTMPDIPGLLLWKQGHVGIYIGNGYAVEAMGTVYGVVKTRVQGRGWSKWGKLPCLQFIEDTEETEPPAETTPTT